MSKTIPATRTLKNTHTSIHTLKKNQLEYIHQNTQTYTSRRIENKYNEIGKERKKKIYLNIKRGRERYESKKVR